MTAVNPSTPRPSVIQLAIKDASGLPAHDEFDLEGKQPPPHNPCIRRFALR